MSGAALEVEEAARGGLGGVHGGVQQSPLADEKAVLETESHQDSDQSSEVVRGPNGEEYPTKDELTTLPRVHGTTSWVLYTIGHVQTLLWSHTPFDL